MDQLFIRKFLIRYDGQMTSYSLKLVVAVDITSFISSVLFVHNSSDV